MPMTPHVIALGLFGPAFAVAGVLLVGVPILIHLLNRQRFKVVDWAAMEFLLRAMRKNRKRMKVEQWLLLATRCLVVLLVGLALARPWGGCEDSSLAGAVAGRAGVNVFVIDNSLSNAYLAPHVTVKGMDGQPLPPAKTHLEQQKQMARVLIDTLSHGGESVAIITAARPATAITVRPGYNLAEAQTIVDRIEQSYAGTDMAGALQLANRMADEDPKTPSRNLYLFSDGTRGAWANEQQAETLKRLGPEVARRYKVTHFNMTEGKQQWNDAAVDLRPTDNLVTTRFESGLMATVRGYGTAPDASLQLFVDDRKLGMEKTIRPDPTSPPISERLLPDQVKVGGPHLFTAAVNADRAGDALKADDRRYRVVDVAAEVKVLIVEGQVSERYNESSASFLKSALAPQEEGSGVLTAGPRSKTHVTAQVGSEADLKDRPLRDYKAVILAGVERLDDKAADNLAAFVKDGGALLTFVGEKLQPENYNTVLLSRGLIPGRIVAKDDRRGSSTAYVFDFNPKAQVVHRYLDTFKLQQNTGLDTARINTFWKLDVSTNPAVERVLNYVPAPVDPMDKRDAAAGTAAAAARPPRRDQAAGRHRPPARAGDGGLRVDDGQPGRRPRVARADRPRDVGAVAPRAAGRGGQRQGRVDEPPGRPAAGHPELRRDDAAEAAGREQAGDRDRRDGRAGPGRQGRQAGRLAEPPAGQAGRLQPGASAVGDGAGGGERRGRRRRRPDGRQRGRPPVPRRDRDDRARRRAPDRGDRRRQGRVRLGRPDPADPARPARRRVRDGDVVRADPVGEQRRPRAGAGGGVKPFTALRTLGRVPVTRASCPCERRGKWGC